MSEEATMYRVVGKDYKPAQTIREFYSLLIRDEDGEAWVTVDEGTYRAIGIGDYYERDEIFPRLV